MGWVTLTARKKELKAKHSATQFQALCISRQKRQLAREKLLNSTLFQNNENAEVKEQRTLYNSATSALSKYSEELTEYLNALKKAKESKAEIDPLNGNYANGVAFKTDDAEMADSYVWDGMELYLCDYGDGNPVLMTKDNADKVSGYTKTKITPESVTYEKNDKGNVTDIDIKLNGSTYSTSKDDDSEIPISFPTKDLEKAYFVAEAVKPTKPAGYTLSSLSSYDGDNLEEYIETISSEITTIKSEIETKKGEEQTKYQAEIDSIKRFWETEKELIEAEAADEELYLDLEQTEVETEMEAISNEMQSVGDAVSNQIQQNTIKLA